MSGRNRFKDHLREWNNLVTTYEATRAGFVSIALEKNRKATPFVEEARALRNIAAKVKDADDLAGKKDIYPAMLTASGLSEKALNHLTEDDKEKAIKNLIDKFLKPAGKEFIDELVYRFLLTRGDSLGGAMRNLAGTLGERKFFRSVIATLSIQGIPFLYLEKSSKKWRKGISADLTIDENCKGLYWQKKKKDRLLLLNRTSPIVGKMVDLILLDGRYDETGGSFFSVPENYVALGELKGGIDPAGADEHWKTADTALARIRSSFSRFSVAPSLFFVGAAIEKSMAKEIYRQLEQGILTNAANLTDENQLASICSWLCDL